MLIRSALPFLLVFTIASACGKDKAPPHPDSTSNQGSSAGQPRASAEPHLLHVAPGTTGAMLAIKAKISCGEKNSAACPSAVGMLVMELGDGTYAQCTAFLVASGVAITNSHCVPEELKAAGSSCRNRGWLTFPAIAGLPEQQVGCSEIVAASALPAASSRAVVRDYAVIRLAGMVSGRKPLEISRLGFADQERVRIAKVNPDGTASPGGTMQNISCQAVHGSALVRNSRDSLADTMAFGDCAVVHGNSGSPILDADGKVRGVIQFTYEADDPRNQESLRSLALFDGKLSALGGGTSFACLDFPADVPAPATPLNCAAREAAVDDEKILNEKANALLEEKFAGLDSSLPSAFSWTVQSSEEKQRGARGFLVVPDCAQASAAEAPSEVVTPVTLPRFELIQGVNRYFVQDVQVNPQSPLATSLRYDASGLRAVKETKVELLTSGEATPFFSKTLGFCSSAP